MTFPSVPLSSVVTVNPRGWTEPPEPDEPVSFIRMAAVEVGTGKLDPFHHRPWHEVQKGYTKFEEGDVLFAKITPSMENGKAALAVGLAGGRGVGSTEFHVLRPADQVDPRYLLHFVLQERFRREARAQMRGVAGQLRVPPEFFKDICIPLPSLDEQKQIVDEIESQFARLDDAVAALQRARTRLKRYRASVLKAACEGRLVPTEAELARQEGRDYEPASVLLDRIKAERESSANGKRRKYKNAPPLDTTNLPELPKGWAWTTVVDLNPADRHCAYGVLQPGPDIDGGVPFVRVGDVNNGVVSVDGLKYINASIAAKYPRTTLHGGEVLISLVGAIGRTAVAPQSLSGANVARAVGVIPLTCAVNANWVEIWFRNPEKVLEMTGKAHEVARKTLNLEDVRAASVAIPPIEEQNRLVAEVERRFSVAVAMEATIEMSLRRAEALRQSILRKAFSGQLTATSVDTQGVTAL